MVTADDRHPALMGMLRQASYDIRLYGEGAQVISGSLPGFLEQASIEAIRKTKSGEKLVDIRPMIHELHVTERRRSASQPVRARVVRGNRYAQARGTGWAPWKSSQA